jgi:signal transduction histidine kinase
MSFDLKKRWLYYLLAGIIFGVFDFYFQNWVQVLSFWGIWINIPILGIWLLLLMPTAIVEIKTSNSPWLTATASAFTWSTAVVAYYLFNGIKLIVIGEPSRPEMHLSNRGDAFYWNNVRAFFSGDFVSGVGEWLVIAIIGGSLIGLLIAFVMQRLKARQDS